MLIRCCVFPLADSQCMGHTKSMDCNQGFIIGSPKPWGLYLHHGSLSHSSSHHFRFSCFCDGCRGTLKHSVFPFLGGHTRNVVDYAVHCAWVRGRGAWLWVKMIKRQIKPQIYWSGKPAKAICRSIGYFNASKTKHYCICVLHLVPNGCARHGPRP